MVSTENIPEERIKTIRQEIVEILSGGEHSAADLSKIVRKSEKEIYDHLSHILQAGEIKIVPAICATCSYKFDERSKVKKPTKCPKCKSTRIDPPLFIAL